MASLSNRGRALIDDSPKSTYFAVHFEHKDDPDYIGLCIAENKLVWDHLQPRLIEPRLELPHEAICYDEMIGSRRFRQQLSDFMGRRFLGRRFDPDHIAVLAGAGSVLEILFHNLADSGDGILVPTPSYAGFWADLETRDQLNIVTVDKRSEDGFVLTEDLLDETFESADRPIKALLYTNPDNPTGAIASREEIEMVARWTRSRDIHLIVDEIYALSIHGSTEFVSVAEVVPDLGDSIHIVWAFSKDFGASGLRAGVLITENEELMESIGALGYWSLVSGDTQHLLGEMISDDGWIDAYLETMQTGLRNAYETTSVVLDAAGLRRVPAEGGFFMLLDLRDHLDEPSWEAEDRLWRRILDEAKVNLTPGSACRINEPGFLRVCFAARPTDQVVTAMERLVGALDAPGSP